ncbi:hypothetical protein P154DRAFT_562864 [Amniculicola lignicola CBS 123094]|uniref:2EXR domain-containing protein n=1 Tax=Amniculicola lignicola CBS 123094 TaxID=1392246 RepID=A0A6A5WH95_9PLEO|nr:hypothetical protein P154DRAFT_562864 [Amniculicola lignicola CBS 123094]
MPPTTFAQLPRELRDMIWSAAAAIQYQSIANSKSHACTAAACQNGSLAERLRQAFIGYENISPDSERQRLRLYVHDSHRTGRLHLGKNEFQILVNYLPIATACSEARSHAIEYCLSQVEFPELWYNTTEEPGYVGDEIREPISLQPTTIILAKSDFEDRPGQFNSAEHLVDVVKHVFGSKIHRIIMNLVFRSYNTFAQMYWPYTENYAELLELRNINRVVIEDQNHGQDCVFMESGTRRTVHVPEYLKHCREPNRTKLEQLAYHLQKHQEILEAAREKLPQLENIKLELTSHCWDKIFTSFYVTSKSGGMCVSWPDYQFGMEHTFEDLGGPEWWGKTGTTAVN